MSGFIENFAFLIFVSLLAPGTTVLGNEVVFKGVPEIKKTILASVSKEEKYSAAEQSGRSTSQKLVDESDGKVRKVKRERVGIHHARCSLSEGQPES